MWPCSIAEHRYSCSIYKWRKTAQGYALKYSFLDVPTWKSLPFAIRVSVNKS